MKFNFKSLALLLPGALMCLTSCSSEEPAVNPSGPSDEGIGYLSLTIQSQTRSRADGDTQIGNEVFNNGDKQEYAICPNLESNAVLFFDDQNNFYGMTYLKPYADKLTPDTQHGTHEDGYPETYYTYITRWRNTTAQKPTQVLVVLNADPTKLEALATELTGAGGQALNMARTKTYDSYENGNYVYGIYKYGGENYFTMSNSAYLSNGGDATVTSIDALQVCATAEEALANPVTVYVERLLSKFQLFFGNTTDGLKELTTNDNNIFMSPTPAEGASANSVKVHYVSNYTGAETNLDYPSYDSYDWQAYIVNWGINGLEKKGKLLKDITNNSDYFLNWNAANYHRSYWGESANYAETANFTTQYRNASYDPDYATLGSIYSGNTDYNPANETAQLNTLHYVSFNDLKTRAQYKYTGERTYNPEAGLTGYGPYRFASHYLIGAQLVIKGIDTDTESKNASQQLTNISDKYYAYNYFWATPEMYIRYAYRRMATQATDGRTHNLNINGVQTTIAGISDGYLYTAPGVRLEVSEADAYFDLVSAQTVHGDGKQVLSLKSDKELYIKTGENQYAKLTPAQVTAMIYAFSEPVKHFNKGAMYYAIPVQHNKGLYSADNTVKVTKDGTYDLGQFGAVRNHWYRLTVSAINNIGIPVDNPDQPIIPDPEDEYYVAVEIVVLPWNVIDNGSVGL